VISDNKDIYKQIDALRAEKNELDALIESLPPLEGLQIQRAKKQKTDVESRIRRLEDSLLPDIIA
jgi:hypothetical protein